MPAHGTDVKTLSVTANKIRTKMHLPYITKKLTKGNCSSLSKDNPLPTKTINKQIFHAIRAASVRIFIQGDTRSMATKTGKKKRDPTKFSSDLEG